MELLTTYPVKTSDLGFHGNLFGGQLLKILDWAVVAYACQKTDSPSMVTASIDKCNFVQPVKQGQLVKIYAEMDRLGRTSVRFNVEVRSHDVLDGHQEIVLNTGMTFVKIDENGKPTPFTEKVMNQYKNAY